MVTRGNVAIYCYNALTAKTWDVAESTGNELTSMASEKDTILAKFFSDFVNKSGTMKLVKDATVVRSGANTTAIGENQVEIKFTGIVDFIEAETAPKRGKDSVTYHEKNVTNAVIAYIPENVADVATLAGKTVDVIFGKDNEVAYISVTDDAIDRVYVTAWDNSDAEIELDDVTYEVLEDAKVYVLGYEVNKDAGADWTAVEVINEIITKTYNFGVTKPTKTFNRNIIADVILNEDSEVTSINFIGSTNVVAGAPVVVNEKDSLLYVEEVVVKKITDSGRLVTIFGDSVIEDAKLETLDKNKVTVIKDGEIIKAEEIKQGDVLTVLTLDTNTTPERIYVSDVRVEGTVDSFNNTYSILTIDGEDYNVSNPIVNKEGDIEKAAKSSFVAKEFYDVEVELYLNFMGEVSAIVGETAATNSAFGVIASVPYYEAEKGDDAEYIGMKILTKDGKKSSYKIYNSKAEDGILDITDGFEYENGKVTFDSKELKVGTLVTFTSNDDKEILFDAEDYEDNKFAGFAFVEGAKTTIEGKELSIVTLPKKGASATLSNEEFKFVKAGQYFVVKDSNGKETKYYFDDAELFNVYEGKVDEVRNPSVIKWSSLVDGNTNVFAKDQLIFVDEDNNIKYFVAKLDSYASEATDDAYAIVLTTVPVDSDEYDVTLFADGKEITAKYDGNNAEALVEGDFVKFKLENDEEFDTITVIANVDDILVAENKDQVTINGSEITKGNLVAKQVSNGAIRYKEYEDTTRDAIGLCEDEEYTIYYVTEDGYEMVSDLDTLEGKVVFGFHSEECDCDSELVDILVVIK